MSQASRPIVKVLLIAAAMVLAGVVVWKGVQIYQTQSLWSQASDAARRGQWDQAALLLNQRASWSSDTEESARLRSFAALKQGDEETAIRVLETTSETWRSAGESFLTLGALKLKRFRLREAEMAYETASRLKLNSPSQESCWLGLAAIYAAEGRDAEFDHSLNQLMRSPSPQFRLQALRLVAAGVPVIPPDPDGRKIDDLEALNTAVQIDSAYPPIVIALAELKRKQGDPDQALKLLEPFTSRHLSARLVQIQCLLDQGEFESAYWTQAKKDFADQINSSWRFAVVSSELAKRSGELDAALESMNQALKLQPRNPEIHYRLADLLRLKGQTTQAQEHSQHAELVKDLVALVGIGAPEPLDFVEAERLCRALGRDQEANAWSAFARQEPQP